MLKPGENRRSEVYPMSRTILNFRGIFMSKPKFTPEQKIAIIKRYLSGEESSKGLATAHGLGTTTIKG